MMKFKVGDKVTVVDCKELIEMNEGLEFVSIFLGNIDMLEPDLKGVVVEDNSSDLPNSYIVDFGEDYHGVYSDEVRKHCVLVLGEALKLTEEPNKELTNVSNVEVYGLNESIKASKYPMSTDVSTLNSDITPTVIKLAQSKKGEGHDNFLNGIIVQFDLTFTVKAWTEAERYHFLDFVSSQSTMHKITKFDLDKAYIKYVDKRVIDIMKEKVQEYNSMQDNETKKEKYLEILYTNPCGMKLTARMTTNYRQLKTIYAQRKTHRLPEWQEFCKWIETLPHSELIVGD